MYQEAKGRTNECIPIIDDGEVFIQRVGWILRQPVPEFEATQTVGICTCLTSS